MAEATEFADRSSERADFEVRGDLAIVVRHTSPMGVEEELDARPLDLSFGGMKFSIATPLVFAEPIKLHFLAESLKIDFVTGAEVRWIRPGNHEDDWNVGCAFESHLSDEWLDKLTAAAGVDRRESPRKNTKIQATVQLACSPKPFNVTLLDYSNAGLCFSSSDAVEPKEPLRMQLTDSEGVVYEVMAKCAWKKPFQSGYLIGCEVGGKHRGKFELWRKAIATAAPQLSGIRGIRMWLCVFGCVLGASILALSWLMFW